MSDRVRLAAIAAVGLPALALVVAAIVLLLGRGADNAPIIITPPATPDPAAAAAVSAPAVQPAPTPSEIWVHISGRVASPGLYPMQPGQRVADVVLRAGGALPDGDLSVLNLARRLTDEAQYHIPALGAANSGGPAGAVSSSGNPAQSGNAAGSGNAASSSTGGTGGTGGGISGGLVNLNRAGAAELETLPGIGPVLAADIIRFRQSNGPFQTIDELEEVPGIGPKTMQKLRPLTTVAP